MHLEGNEMSKTEISERLKALAAKDTSRTATARLREVFDEVQATFKAGVSQADVLAELNASGLKMTMASFKSALQRIRKERSNQVDTLPPVSSTTKNQLTPVTTKQDKQVGQPEKQMPRITNPSDVRRARSREIDLESLINDSDEQE